MGNMSYCRFRNTLNDLRDCYETMVEEWYELDKEINREEYRARKQLIELCVTITEDFWRYD